MNENVFAHFRIIHKSSVLDVIVTTTIVVDVTLKTIYCDIITYITVDVEVISGLLGASDAVIPDCKPIRLFIHFSRLRPENRALGI